MPILHAVLRRITGPKCRVTSDEKEWIERRFRWLQGQFGSDRVQVPVLKPTLKIFPRQWEGTLADCRELLTHLCEYMEVPRASIDLR